MPVQNPNWLGFNVAETIADILLSTSLSNSLPILSNREIRRKVLGSVTGLGDPLWCSVILAVFYCDGNVVVRMHIFKAISSDAVFYLAIADMISLIIQSGPGNLPDGSLDRQFFAGEELSVVVLIRS